MTQYFTIGINTALVPVAFIVGLIYAFILYRKNRIEDISSRQHILLFALRFLSVSAIVFLLFNPMIRQLKSTVEKPVVVLAHDNSLSVVSTKDSAYYNTEWTQEWERFTKTFEKDFNVRSLLFGETVIEGVMPSYNEYYTDLSSLSTDLTRRFSGRNVAAVVVATDGIMNRGIDPVWTYNLDAPVYAVALGDTSQIKDRYIKRIITNEITYMGNSFPLEVELGAELSQGENLTLTVYKNGKRVESQNIEVASDRFFTTAAFALPADKPGLQRYSVRINSSNAEVNTRNNTRDFYIRVLDGRKKVALLSSFMSPDISAIMQSLSALNSYETAYVDLKQGAEFTFDDFDILILYGMPESSVIRERVMDSGLPTFVIYTHIDNYQHFNALETGVLIDPKTDDGNVVYPVVNDDFSAFGLPEGFSELVRSFAPLTVPFAEFQTAAGVNTMLYQKVGSVDTDMPLLSVSKSLERRYCTFIGDGFWKWRISNVKQYGDADLFDQFISGIMQYLSIRDEKQFLYVNCEEQFFENERVLITSEVYDENYELNNEGEVSLTLTSENGDKFPFVMVRQGKGYMLDAGNLIPGKYTWSATVQHPSGLISRSGAFVVSEVITELNDLVANHNVLRHLSAQNNGSTYYPSNITELQEMLQSGEQAKPVVSTREVFKTLITDIRVFILILLLLSLEWFLRRYAGSY